MSMIISVINNKGGTGKTTTSVNLAAALSRLGKRVLVVDIDSQCNATEFLNEGRGDATLKTLYNLYDPVEVEVKPQECIYTTAHSNLYLLPNTPETAVHGAWMVKTGADSMYILRKRLRSYVLQNFDYTLLDCPPNLEAFVISALIASDFVIVPTQAGSKFSLQGLLKAKEFIEDIKAQYNPDLRFLKVLITMVDYRTTICKSVMSAIRQAFPANEIFKAMIPENTAFQKSEFRKQTIFKYNIGAPGAFAYLVVAKELIAAVEEDTVGTEEEEEEG